MFRIRVLFNNSAGKGKYSTNGKVIKGIKERLSSKQGLMRDNLMGKRVNESGRTVMGPEPTLSIDEIGIPNEMAQILTVPERVTRYNLYKLQALLKTTKISRIWIAETDKVINVKFSTDCIALRIGDVVQRQVMDGDPIVLNRQPTLHRGSLMALRAKLWNGKTLRVNLPITKSFNMDFDGDEGNVHVPQSYLARTELLHLSTPHNLLLSAQNGQANIVLVQDNMLAVYLMTNETHFLKIAYVYDMMLDLVNETGKGWNQHRITERWEHIQSRIDPTSGHGLLSFCLPSTLTWSFENVMIEQGVLVRGVLNKRSVNALLKTIAHVYPSETAVMVINNIVFITNRWLSHRGFTVGLEDCLLHSNQAYDMISSCILKCFTETIAITSTIHHDRVREIRIQEALNRTRDIGMRIAKEGFHPSNNFIQTVSSGSKGDYFNITQISGMLGQQYLKGARIPMRLNNKTRSLYHYPFDIKDELQKYEARGFVRHSFFRGLSPREMYFHAVTGRSGLVDTAMGTSETGYIQRRLVKMMEDITVANDQTIRDDTQQIYQFSFGRHGLKPDGCPLSNLQVLADSLE
jgi:DNA-directed RNA polymerase beta' subunit